MLVFRTDGNPKIGLGHVMRCLSIADASAMPCLFVMSDDSLEEFIIHRGHAVVNLGTGCGFIKREIEMLNAILKKCHPIALLMDSYLVTHDYLLSVYNLCKANSCKLLYIDDILAFPYPCDILLNYNIYGNIKEAEYKNMYAQKGMKLPELLLGSAFTPLRKEFQNLPFRHIKKNAKNIFVSTGASDTEHILRGMIECIIQDNQHSYLNFHVVVGSMNSDWNVLQQLARGIKNIVFHYNVSDMTALMSGCDIAISAAGSTLYELCAMQVPIITYTFVDNQILGAMEFERQKILKYIGDVRNMGLSGLCRQLITEAIELIYDYDERVRIAAFQKRIIDGKGANRIIAKLI